MFRSKTAKVPALTAVMTAPPPPPAMTPPDAPAAMLTIDDHPVYRAAQQKVADLRARRTRIAEQIRTEKAKSVVPVVEGADATEAMLARAIASDPTAPAAPLDELREQYGLLGEALRRAEVECGQARKEAARELADLFRPREYAQLEDKVARAKLVLRMATHDLHDFLLKQDGMVALDLYGMSLDRDEHGKERIAIHAELTALNARAS
jgi:hypothetical protein